jgi:hypothetical protein
MNEIFKNLYLNLFYRQTKSPKREQILRPLISGRSFVHLKQSEYSWRMILRLASLMHKILATITTTLLMVLKFAVMWVD